jgi:3-deoxy-D-manno-octulosonic-acid transferase
MSAYNFLYNMLLPLAYASARVAAPFNEKISEGLKGRKNWKSRWKGKKQKLADTKYLIWFHVSSVGEFEQAKPVMKLLSTEFGTDLNLALTFFSPSGMNYFKKFDRSSKIPALNFVEYLPIDSRKNVNFCLDVLKPDMIVYVKFDLWPNLVTEAHRRSIPQLLVSGTLSPGSGRLNVSIRNFYGELYSKLSGIAAISPQDARRFGDNSQGEVEIVVGGDTRFDQVCDRIESSQFTLSPALKNDTRRHLIAGSTWPPDERMVIPAFSNLAKKFSDLALILAPHEPSQPRLENIYGTLKKSDLSYKPLSQINREENITESVIVADGLGYLAELYQIGDIAFVGGSFYGSVHNVMEPAVFGLPVFFGPDIENSLEAKELVRNNSGKIVNSAQELEKAAEKLLTDRAALDKTGKMAQQYIRDNCGAAQYCLDFIKKYLDTERLTRDR